MSRFSLVSRIVFCSSLAICFLLFATSNTNAEIVYGNLADAERALNGTIPLASISATTLRAGRLSTGTDPSLRRNAILVFDITTVSNAFSTADFGLYFQSKTLLGATPTNNVDLYGVGFASSAAAFPAFSSFVNANTGPGAKIQDNFVTPSTPAGQMLSTNAVGDAALLAFLNTRPTGANGNFVFFRANQDGQAGGNNRFYSFRSADFAGTTSDPILTFTTVPEPGSALLLGSVVFAGVLRRRRNR